MTKTEIEKLIKRWDESLVDENEEFELAIYAKGEIIGYETICYADEHL